MDDLVDLAAAAAATWFLNGVAWLWAYAAWVAAAAVCALLAWMLLRGAAILNGPEGAVERDDAYYLGPEASHSLRPMPDEQPKPTIGGAR